MGLLKQFEYAEPPEEVIETKEVLAPVPVVETVPERELTVADLVVTRSTRGLIDTIDTVKNGERIKLNFKRDNAGRLTKISRHN